MGALACIIIGPDEQQAGTVTLKNMTVGNEQTIAQTDLIKTLTI